MDNVYDKIKYNNKYNKENYDHINLTVPKGQKEIIRKHAEAQGLKINTYIKQLIDKDLSGGGRRDKVVLNLPYVVLKTA